MKICLLKTIAGICFLTLISGFPKHKRDDSSGDSNEIDETGGQGEGSKGIKVAEGISGGNINVPDEQTGSSGETGVQFGQGVGSSENHEKIEEGISEGDKKKRKKNRPISLSALPFPLPFGISIVRSDSSDPDRPIIDINCPPGCWGQDCLSCLRDNYHPKPSIGPGHCPSPNCMVVTVPDKINPVCRCRLEEPEASEDDYDD